MATNFIYFEFVGRDCIALMHELCLKYLVEFTSRNANAVAHELGQMATFTIDPPFF